MKLIGKLEAEFLPVRIGEAEEVLAVLDVKGFDVETS
jgi:hypothetical protein